MNMKNASLADTGTPLPTRVIVLILLVSLAPSIVWFAQALTGVHGFRPSPMGPLDDYGDPFHMILNMVGVCAALFTSALCFAHFARTGDMTTPLLGVGLFCAAVIDLWRTLVAAGIVMIATPLDVFQPLAWTLARGFYALVLLVTASMFILSSRVRGESNRGKGAGIAASLGLALALLASLIIVLAGQAPDIATTLYTGLDRVIFDAGPLLLLLFIGLYVLPTYYRWQPSVFTQALWISCIALALAQIHHLLGAGIPFAQRDHTLDLLVIVGYLIPLGGMLLDYNETYRRNERAIRQLRDDLLMLSQSENATMREREFTAAVLDAMAAPACIMDSSLRVTRANAALASLAGLSDPQQALGKTLPALLQTDGTTHTVFGLKAVETKLVQETPAIEWTLPNGEKRRMAWIHRPVTDEKSRVVAVIGLARLA